VACPRQSIGSGSGSSPVPWLSGFSYAMQRTNNSSATLFEEEQHCPLDGLAFRLAHVGRQSQGGPARPLGSVASVDQAARVCGRGIGRLLLQAGGVVSHSSGSRPRGRVPGQLAGHRSLMWRSRRRSSPAPQRYWLSAIAACVVILARASPQTASPHRCRRRERQRLPAGYGPGALSCLRVVDEAEGNAGAASNSAKAPINSKGLSTLADAIRLGLAVAVGAATADVLDGGHDSARSPPGASSACGHAGFSVEAGIARGVSFRR
jgi:hypothetical protein